MSPTNKLIQKNKAVQKIERKSGEKPGSLSFHLKKKQGKIWIKVNRLRKKTGKRLKIRLSQRLEIEGLRINELNKSLNLNPIFARLSLHTKMGGRKIKG